MSEAKSKRSLRSVQKLFEYPFGLQGSHGLLILLVVFAAVIRLVMVHHGLPLLLYEDEPIYYDHALGFGLGHWHLAYFKKPGFFLYSYGALYYLAFLYTPFLHWRDFVNAFWQNPTYVATWGRTLSVLFAASSVYLLGRIGQHAYGWSVGLMAAFFLAVDTTQLRISPVVISDIPSLFFILASTWFALKIAEKARVRDYCLCALMIALTISYKYNLFTVAFLIAGHWAAQQQSASYQSLQGVSLSAQIKSALSKKRFWLALGLIPLIFLMLNPLTLLDFSTFQEHLNLEKRHMLLKDASNTTARWEPFVAFKSLFYKILPRNLGWLLYIPGILGAAWGVSRYRRFTLVLLAFPMVFLLVVLQFRLINAKYLLPLFPFWYLMAALLFRDLWRWLAKRWFGIFPPFSLKISAVLLTIAVSFWTWTSSADYLAIYCQPDSRNIAFNTLKAVVHENETVLLEPDTLTLDNRLFRSRVTLAQFQQGRFIPQSISIASMNAPDVLASAPSYVVLNFGEAEKKWNAQRQVYYQMPYAPSYYSALQRDYRLISVFSPYHIGLDLQQMNHFLKQEGFGPLYQHIQIHKSDRQRSGPLMLMLARQPH